MENLIKTSEAICLTCKKRFIKNDVLNRVENHIHTTNHIVEIQEKLVTSAYLRNQEIE